MRCDYSLSNFNKSLLKEGWKFSIVWAEDAYGREGTYRSVCPGSFDIVWDFCNITHKITRSYTSK